MAKSSGLRTLDAPAIRVLLLSSVSSVSSVVKSYESTFVLSAFRCRLVTVETQDPRPETRPYNPVGASMNSHSSPNVSPRCAASARTPVVSVA